MVEGLHSQECGSRYTGMDKEGRPGKRCKNTPGLTSFTPTAIFSASRVFAAPLKGIQLLFGGQNAAENC